MEHDLKMYLATTPGAREMVQAARRASLERGMQPEPVPGHAAVVVNLAAGDHQGIAAIRTSRNRHFGFVPLKGGREWKTLDQVDQVLVTTVDDAEHPAALEVFLFPAQEVKAALVAAYEARTKAGLKASDGYGLWIAIDTDERNVPYSVGSGLGDRFPAIARYTAGELLSGDLVRVGSSATGSEPKTIPEVLAWARKRIGEIGGVEPSAVHLELKIEL